jgi:hypothetical protein
MAKRATKAKSEPIPNGCEICHGDPFIQVGNAASRCSCGRGDWYRARERDHRHRSGYDYMQPAKKPAPVQDSMILASGDRD